MPFGIMYSCKAVFRIKNCKEFVSGKLNVVLLCMSAQRNKKMIDKFYFKTKTDIFLFGGAA